MESFQNSPENKNIRKLPTSIAAAVVWDFIGRVAQFLVVFILGVFLTRLLSPVEFGSFAIVLSVITFSSIFVDLGFRSAIVQSSNTTQEQLSTVFYINLFVSIGMLSIIVVGARYMERFYAIEGLGNYIAIAALLFVINALTLVPNALLQKDLRLKAISFVTTTAALTSGAIAVCLAFSGFGVWSLVAQQLISSTVVLFGLTMLARWRPSVSFNPRAITELWRFGVRMFLAGLLETIFTRLDVLIIGKLFPIQTLGYYSRAQSLDGLVKNFSSSTTTSVAFPVIARMADDTEAVGKFYLRCLNVISFLAFLLIGILFLTCFDIVVILFTEKWIEVGYYFRIMAVTSFIYPISALMVTLITGRGNSAGFLRLELIKKTILFPTYLSFFIGGVYVFLIVLGAAFIVALIANALFVEKEISVSLKTQMSAIFKYAVIGIVGVALVFGAVFYIENIYTHLIASSALYAAFYLFFCHRFRLRGFIEIYNRLVSFFNDKRHANFSSAS